MKLELLTDVDMLHFIRKGIRGGIVQCSHRHGVANNKYIPNNLEGDAFKNIKYDSKQEQIYLTYLDANNLYGLALSQYLPYGGFRWLKEEEIANFNVLEKCSNNESNIGYILEVDLLYPEEIHDLHNELPFCAENIIPPNGTSRLPKLIPNLRDKKRYVIHYRNLYQALQHGIILQKIHRIIEFRQSDWLKKYIDKNTAMRQAATNEFDKDKYKLANNAVFGKCMEAVEKRKTVKLVKQWDNKSGKNGAQKIVSQSQLHSIKIFNENFVALQLRKEKVLFDKPIYVGFCVLDISKTVMYDFHYNFIKKKYNDRANLLYTDTDSLIYKISTNDFYNDIKDNINKFDTSNYTPKNPYSMPLVNKAVLGAFKDEAKGNPILEFVGLRPKLYDYVVAKQNNDGRAYGEVIKKSKGVKKSVVKRLKHSVYKNCLLKGKVVLCRQHVFRSIKHIIHTEAINKIALSPHDDKRYILSDGISTLAWGHYKLDFLNAPLDNFP